MINRRTFLKSFILAAGVASIPIIVKAEPEPKQFVFDDIGPRGIGQMTEREQQAVQAEVKKHLDKKVRWQIPGRRDNLDRMVVMGNYLVTYKQSSVRSGVVYIEVERTFYGDPPPFLTEWIDTVWKQYMNKRCGRYIT